MLSRSSKWELGFVHYIAKFSKSRFIISRFGCSMYVYFLYYYLLIVCKGFFPLTKRGPNIYFFDCRSPSRHKQRKCSIKAHSKCKISVYVLMEISHQWIWRLDPPYTGPVVRHYCLMAGFTNFFGNFPNGSGEILVSLALFLHLSNENCHVFYCYYVLHISLQEKAQNNLIFFFFASKTYLFFLCHNFTQKRRKKLCVCVTKAFFY